MDVYGRWPHTRGTLENGKAMGLLFRWLAPKPVKKMKRQAAKAMNPMSAMAPKPVKQARRAARTVLNPGHAVGFAAENTAVKALKGCGKKRSKRAERPTTEKRNSDAEQPL